MKTHRKSVVIPMVTPLTEEGSLDESATRRVIDFLIDGEADGIFVLGTTGERASISPCVQKRLVQVAVEHVGGRVPVYVGISDNCLAASVAAAAESKLSGADAVVAHPPCYYALNSEEIFEYYSALARSVDLPLVLYNIPVTTRISIPIDVIARLSDNPKVVGVKDSENNIPRMEALAKLGGRSDFRLLVGVSVLSAKGLFLGMDGVVPSSGNIIPRHWRRLCDGAEAGDWERVDQMQSVLNEVGRVFQRDRNVGEAVAALKAMMSVAGLCSPVVLPPLRPLAAEQIAARSAEMKAVGHFAEFGITAVQEQSSA